MFQLRQHIKMVSIVKIGLIGLAITASVPLHSANPEIQSYVIISKDELPGGDQPARNNSSGQQDKITITFDTKTDQCNADEADNGGPADTWASDRTNAKKRVLRRYRNINHPHERAYNHFINAIKKSDKTGGLYKFTRAQLASFMLIAIHTAYGTPNSNQLTDDCYSFCKNLPNNQEFSSYSLRRILKGIMYQNNLHAKPQDYSKTRDLQLDDVFEALSLDADVERDLAVEYAFDQTPQTAAEKEAQQKLGRLHYYRCEDSEEEDDEEEAKSGYYYNEAKHPVLSHQSSATKESPKDYLAAAKRGIKPQQQEEEKSEESASADKAAGKATGWVPNACVIA